MSSSSKLTFYGADISPPCRSVSHVLKEYNIPFNFKSINIFTKEHKTPEYLKVNPHGLIPAMVEDDYQLYESAAILVYLAEKHNLTSVYPKDLKQRGLILQYLSWHDLNINKMRSNVLFKVDTEASAKNLAENLKELETAHFNKKSPYLYGLEHFSLADLHLYNELILLDILKLVDLSVYTVIGQFMKAIETHSKAAKGVKESFIAAGKELNLIK